jgi:hypothetical protein
MWGFVASVLCSVTAARKDVQWLLNKYKCVDSFNQQSVVLWLRSSKSSSGFTLLTDKSGTVVHELNSDLRLQFVIVSQNKAGERACSGYKPIYDVKIEGEGVKSRAHLTDLGEGVTEASFAAVKQTVYNISVSLYASDTPYASASRNDSDYLSVAGLPLMADAVFQANCNTNQPLLGTQG